MMRLWGEDVEVYLYREPVDMRRGRNGLAALVQEAMKLDPFGSGVFVFVGRRSKRGKTPPLAPQRILGLSQGD